MAGWGSDNWFQGRRVPLMVLSALGLIFAVMGLWYLSPGDFGIASVLVGIIGFLVFGPQMLVGLAAAEFVSKKAASTSNGFAGCFAYLGAAVAGYPLGQVTEIYGWYGFIVTLVVCAILTAVILLPIWSVRKGRNDGDPAEQVAVAVEKSTDKATDKDLELEPQ
jgi:OPA family sugar phosphate sensor protein UhpC-like MFS transporter